MISFRKHPPRIVGAIIILVLLLAPQAFCLDESPQVIDLVIRPESNEVELEVLGPIEYGYFPLSEPDRLVFDFPGAILRVGNGATIEQETDGACFHMVRLSQFSLDPPITRLVLYLHEPGEAIVSYSPSDNRIVIQANGEGWEMDPFPTDSDETAVATGVSLLSAEGTPDAVDALKNSYQIAAGDSDVTIRFNDLDADDITVNRLSFPDRLHVRIYTAGPTEGGRLRFEPLDRGSIRNQVVRQWTSFYDRDGNGVVDLTIHLYPNVDFAQSISASGVPEVRLFGLPNLDFGPEPSVEPEQAIEIEVAAYYGGAGEETSEPAVESSNPAVPREDIYEIESTENEVLLRFPGLSTENTAGMSVSQLSFPDRLRVRMFTDGPVEGASPRFEPLERGNIWNQVAKHWASYYDRDGLGVVDLTVYLHPNTGYTQGTGVDGVPEVRLSELASDPALQPMPSVEIGVAAYDSGVVREGEVIPASEQVTEEEPVLEPKVRAEYEEIEGGEEIAEEEIVGETVDIEVAVISDVAIIPAIETIEVIENGTLIAEAGAFGAVLAAPVYEPFAPESPRDMTGDGSDGAIDVSRQNLIRSGSDNDNNRLYLRVGEVVVVPVRDLVRASVGNPGIATLNVISQDELLVTALSSGTTTLLTWEGGWGHESREITVVDATLAQEEEIEGIIDNPGISVSYITSGESPGVVLEGHVATDEEMARAVSIATLFSSADRVMNLIEVTDPRQVLVKVRVVEINRRDLDEHLSHFSAAARTDTDDFTIGIITDLLDPEFPGGGLMDTRVRPGIVNADAQDVIYDPIDLVLNELVVNRRATILSQPNLVALSGSEAHFRVGGEIPYTYQNENGVNVVEFKEFGIQVDMVPFVDSQGNIRLHLEPTVRTVDMALAIAGIPGFRTREMKTDLQLRSGETLVIGGLIEHEITEIISEVPILCEIPVLGQLFRSKRFSEDETELVIFITPYIIENTPEAERLVDIYIGSPTPCDR